MDKIDKIFIINMDKDIERYEKCKQQLMNYNITNYERYAAINGSKLTIKEKESITTNIGNIIASSSMIGCGISHINLWKKIVNDGINKTIILEDDFIFKKDFLNKFNDIYKYAPDNYDMIFLTDNLFHNKNFKFNDINSHFYKQFLISQTLAYIITIDGAKKLLKHINKITYHIDVQLCILGLLTNDINIISIKEPLIYQTYNTSNNINDCYFPLVIDKFLLKHKDIKYLYKAVIFSIMGMDISLNCIFVLLFGFFNISIAIVLLIAEYLIFNDKKINVQTFLYLFIGYLLKVSLYVLK